MTLYSHSEKLTSFNVLSSSNNNFVLIFNTSSYVCLVDRITWIVHHSVVYEKQERDGRGRGGTIQNQSLVFDMWASLTSSCLSSHLLLSLFSPSPLPSRLLSIFPLFTLTLTHFLQSQHQCHIVHLTWTCIYYWCSLSCGEWYLHMLPLSCLPECPFWQTYRCKCYSPFVCYNDTARRYGEAVCARGGCDSGGLILTLHTKHRFSHVPNVLPQVGALQRIPSHA